MAFDATAYGGRHTKTVSPPLVRFPISRSSFLDREQNRRRVAVQAVESRRIPVPPAPDVATGLAEDGTAVPVDETGPSPAGLSAISPPSTATSVVGKVLTGMGRFFGIAQDDAVQSPGTAAAAAAAAADGSNPQGEDVAGAERGAVAAQSLPLADDAGPGDDVAVGTAAAAAAAAAASGAAVVAGVAVARKNAAPTEGEPASGGAEGGAVAGGTAAMDQLQHVGSQEDMPSAAAVAKEASLRGRSLSPEEVQAYSDKVDQTLEVRVCVCVSVCLCAGYMSGLLVLCGMFLVCVGRETGNCFFLGGGGCLWAGLSGMI